jgi:hypothetical protein
MVAFWTEKARIIRSIGIQQMADVLLFHVIVRSKKLSFGPFAVNLGFRGHRVDDEVCVSGQCIHIVGLA